MFNIRKATVAQISTLLMTLTYRMLPMTLNLPCPAAQFRSLEFWIYHFFLCFIDICVSLIFFLVFISFEHYLSGVIFCVLFEDFHFPLSFLLFIDVVYSYSHFITSIFHNFFLYFKSYQFSSVALSCLTLCNPMNHSTPDLPVHYQLPEFYPNPCPLSQ